MCNFKNEHSQTDFVQFLIWKHYMVVLDGC